MSWFPLVAIFPNCNGIVLPSRSVTQDQESGLYLFWTESALGKGRGGGVAPFTILSRISFLPCPAPATSKPVLLYLSLHLFPAPSRPFLPLSLLPPTPVLEVDSPHSSHPTRATTAAAAAAQPLCPLKQKSGEWASKRQRGTFCLCKHEQAPVWLEQKEGSAQQHPLERGALHAGTIRTALKSALLSLTNHCVFVTDCMSYPALCNKEALALCVCVKVTFDSRQGSL